MKDIREAIDNLRDRLWNKFGNPLSSYKETQDDVNMTYYVGRLMKELGHKYVMSERISGEKENRAHYSDSALHDAFLAGRLIERKSKNELRRSLREEIKQELMNALEDL